MPDVVSPSANVFGKKSVYFYHSTDSSTHCMTLLYTFFNLQYFTRNGKVSGGFKIRAFLKFTYTHNRKNVDKGVIEIS